ncbi:polygalacturonase 1 precursor [Diaporthe helianthi]|uniref:endo-polygalacturonase n=1 Tax=Diaporthe helianthi TaxID=158607 RepID=A0A2P5HF33_DIAHE|nr:polygalacturonase 1 precursor [Diaporthe helianthi]
MPRSIIVAAGAALCGLAVGALAADCTFSGSDGYLQASQNKKSCSNIVLDSLEVPGGVTLNLENLNDGTTVTFQGRTTWAYAEWEGSLFSVSGNNITIKGAPGHVLDGQGHLWWDTLGGGGGVTKPKFFKANNLNDSVLDSINIQNAPKNFYSINYVNNLLAKNLICNNTAGDQLKDGRTLGHNTDAFNVNNANGVVIQNAIVYNQDDCVAVNSGQHVLFKDGFCSGGHGGSIGSVGGRTNNVVRNITFENIHFSNSQQSVRIKTVANETGSVSDVTYRNIVIDSKKDNADYGIIVSQSYGGVKGQPTNGVPITNFVLQNVTGTVYKGAVNVYIECGEGSCSDWTWTDVKVDGGKKATNCQNVPQGISC